MTGAELSIIGSCAFGKYWIKPMARRLGIRGHNLVLWKQSKVPRSREQQVVDLCREAAVQNLKSIHRIARYVKQNTKKRLKNEERRIAARSKRVRETHFSRTRKVALAQYLKYRKKADSAELGHKRRKRSEAARLGHQRKRERLAQAATA